MVTGYVDYESYINRSIFYGFESREDKENVVSNYLSTYLNEKLFLIDIEKITVTLTGGGLEITARANINLPLVGGIFRKNFSVLFQRTDKELKNTREFVRMFDIFGGVVEQVPEYTFELKVTIGEDRISMELHPEYIRDMHNHYMILKGGDKEQSNYTAKMLMSNSINGILHTELRHLDNLDLYYYDITLKRSLKAIWEGRTMDYSTTKKMIKDILEIIERSEEFLLVEHDFIITPEFIYLDNNDVVTLCYMPNYSYNILEQLSHFYEYIMNKIDYKDEAAVRLIYAIYKESKDVECTFYRLYEVINQSYNPQDIFNEGEDTSKGEVSALADENILINNCYSNHIKGEITKDRKVAKEIGKKFDKIESQISKLNIKSWVKNKIWISRSDINKNSLSKNISTANKINHGFMRENYHIKSEIDKGEVINDREILYFGQLSYILAGISVSAGIIVLLIFYFTGMVSTSLGNGINQVKLFACILMVICVEIYIMTKIFDPNKRLTKMKAVVEYVEEKSDSYISSPKDTKIFDGTFINTQVSGSCEGNNSNIGENRRFNDELEKPMHGIKEEKTQVLWSEYNNSGEEITQLLTRLEKEKCYYLTPISHKGAGSDKSNKSRVDEYPFYIGKNRGSSNMVIEDKSISRKHGVITYIENKVLYTDLDSTNGTFINGKRLESNTVYNLNPLDEISFANIKYLFEELYE
jgi:hypothetical protein